MGSGGKDDREARLAARLRDNLRRRKQQARAIDAIATTGSAPQTDVAPAEPLSKAPDAE